LFRSVGGMVETSSGSGSLRDLGGVARRAPVFGLLFLVAAFSLAGLPPFSGFVAKLALVQEGLALQHGGIVAVSLLVSLLTLFSMTKIWSGVFWGEVQPESMKEKQKERQLVTSPLMTGATAALILLSLAVSLGAGPLFELSAQAANQLLEPSEYFAAVLGQ
ncbi:MAG: Na+/H+ antiporter subunit D, partial [Actinobacteria bacterium]|nr:Na+/H+ antiporter subunit D [Actinomycetota bacterium]